MTSTAATKSSENVTLRFCNHFLIIQTYYACKMYSSYPGNNGNQPSEIIIWSRLPHNCKTGHFTWWKERERLGNVEKWKLHVQSVQNYCFSLSVPYLLEWATRCLFYFSRHKCGPYLRAALIRGRRLYKNCTRQICFFFIFIQRYTFYLSIFLWTDTNLIVILEFREKFTR